MTLTDCMDRHPAGKRYGRHADTDLGAIMPFGPYIHYGGMARKLRRGDRLPDHAITCPNGEWDHQCPFNARMDGAVLVRTTGERVTA